MISIKLTLDTRRIKQDKTYPIVFRISFNGDSRDIKTGYSVKETDWNYKTSNPRETSKSLQIMLQRLHELHATYLQKIVALEKNPNTYLTVQDVKNELTNEKTVTDNVYDFWKAEINLLKTANRIGGAHVYEESLVAINKVKSLRIRFEKLDVPFLKEVEAELLKNNVKQNSIGVYYRTIRAVYNKAINAKLIGYEHYPFRHFKIKKEKTRPRTISIEEMQKYFSLDLNNGAYIYDSWLLGKLMFMLIGINFKDLLLLKEDNIRQERIYYNRAKTKRLYSIKLLPEAIKIIEYFRQEENLTLLGRLTKEEITDKNNFTLLIRQKNKVFNAHLTKIGKMIGSKEKLTGYVFRYTWANIAKQLGFSNELIAEALGHGYGNKVTGIYLEAFDLKLVDEMNHSIYKAVQS